MPVSIWERGDGYYFVRFSRPESFRRSAYVIGDFNAHSRGSVELKWCGQEICANIALPPGRYSYHYEIDGKQLLDPDPQGSENALVIPQSRAKRRKRDFTSIYQIFVDRFLCVTQEERQVRDQEGDQGRERKGADLRAMADKLDHVKALGFGAVYLTPIFLSPSYHRYDVMDFFNVDDYLGGNAAFSLFLSKAHSLGLEVILDMPVHHTSSRSPYFLEALRGSKFREWYYMDEVGYDTFANAKSMPKLNYNGAGEWMKDVFRHWSTFGVDGFRIDVASGIPPCRLWELKNYVAKPIIAEVWEKPYMWFNAVDGVMNYQLWDAIMKFFQGQTSARDLREVILEQRRLFPRPFALHSWNFLGTHDTPRAFTLLKDKMRAALVLIYFLPGTPLLYYGDEIPMEGNADPDNRRCMDWSAAPALSDLVTKLNALRRPRAIRSVKLRGECLEMETDVARASFCPSGKHDVFYRRGKRKAKSDVFL
ncbi:alpha-amylase family glycosyl hydrolase [Tardisphaera saccharovorans]